MIDSSRPPTAAPSTCESKMTMRSGRGGQGPQRAPNAPTESAEPADGAEADPAPVGRARARAQRMARRVFGSPTSAKPRMGGAAGGQRWMLRVKDRKGRRRGEGNAVNLFPALLDLVRLGPADVPVDAAEADHVALALGAVE